MAKKESKQKPKGLKQKFTEAFGKMKAEGAKEREAERKECSCGGKGCKKCDCGK